MLFSPFKPLTSQSVGYLVRGISEVYGIDVDDDKLQLAQAWKSYAVMPGPAGSGSTSGSITLDLRDAALGQVGVTPLLSITPLPGLSNKRLGWLCIDLHKQTDRFG